MTTPHIIAVDDDPSIRSLVVEYLSENGFRVTAVATGAEMRLVCANDPPALIVLDVKMPGEDGFTVARNLRQTSDVPIIMLTGQVQEIDRVLGLELGADDYLAKPFSPRELLARIKAVMRRYEPRPDPAAAATSPRRDADIRTYRFAGWELSTGTRRLISPSGKRIELTNGEFALLITFLKAPRHVLSRDQLLEGSRLHDDVYDRSIDVQILRLRRKIEADPNEPKMIKTERGAGYFFDAEVVVA